MDSLSNFLLKAAIASLSALSLGGVASFLFGSAAAGLTAAAAICPPGLRALISNWAAATSLATVMAVVRSAGRRCTTITSRSAGQANPFVKYLTTILSMSAPLGGGYASLARVANRRE